MEERKLNGAAFTLSTTGFTLERNRESTCRPWHATHSAALVSLLMLRFSILGFPVTVHWHFWLMAAFISGIGSMQGTEGLTLVLVSMGIIFVSILIHELGHATVMRKFGDRGVSITLYSFGGFAQGTIRHPRLRQIAVSAAGPLASVSLGVLGILVDRAWPIDTWLVQNALHLWLWVNFGWTLLNLLPVLPLDGGRITEAALGPARIRTTLIIGIIVSVIMAGISLLSGRLFTVAFFAMFAYNNWQRLNHQPPADWMRP